MMVMDGTRGGRAPENKVYLNRDGEQPVYAQLADSLRQQIYAGAYRPGERLPSEAQLVEMFQVSPMTVRRAINLLSSQNIVTTARGSGTYVKEVEIRSAAFYLQNLNDLFSAGESTQIKLLEARIQSARDKVARKLHINPGERVIYIRRLLLVHEEPAFYHRGYLVNDPHRPVIEAELEVTDLQGIFRGSGSALIKYADLFLESTLLDEHEASLLKLTTPAPGMMLEHLFYDFDNQPVSWGWFICSSSHLRLHTRLGSQ
jgi:DNA-binding GntR family transcriptional regulator